MTQASLAVREKRKNYERHWTAHRSQLAHQAAHSTPGARKEVKRIFKKVRMAKLYREFFADPAMQKRIKDCKVGYLEQLHPRLCRDIVLGSRA